MRLLRYLFESLFADCARESHVGSKFTGHLVLVPVVRLPRGKTLRKLRTTPAVTWKRVYDLVKRIPKGRVITYGGLAKALHLPGGARTAGWAMGACPVGVPWHRVVGAGGRILLQEPRASLQRRLLESEGTPVFGNRVNFDGREWPDRRTRVKKQSKPRPKGRSIRKRQR
jgi:methylated-DNA-protein-cysteine methyltransferase related protein